MLETGSYAESNNYKGYLVRIWRSSSQAPWRVSIRDTQTGQQYHFAQLEALYAFIGEETSAEQKPQKPEN